MIPTQTAMGVLIVGLCLFGLWHIGWLLEHSRYGRRLVIWFGEIGGRRTLAWLLIAGAMFGVLLATDVIRPIQWIKK
jgi:hypothetical protein